MAFTDCRVCGITTDETLTEHLEAKHLDEVLSIETDPRAGESLIFRIQSGDAPLIFRRYDRPAGQQVTLGAVAPPSDE